MNFLQLKFRLLLPRESVRIKLWFLENEPHKTHWGEHPYHVTALLRSEFHVVCNNSSHMDHAVEPILEDYGRSVKNRFVFLCTELFTLPFIHLIPKH